MKKFSNFLIYLFFVIIIFSLLGIPDVLLAKEENKLEEIIYERAEKQSKIDIEAEKIYLVKAIHNIEKNKVIAINSDGVNKYVDTSEIIENHNMDDIKDEIKKLADYNILKNIEFERGKKENISFLVKMYQNDENTYIINDIDLEMEKSQYQVEIENKTGKILFILFDKSKMNKEISKKEIIENYIKYLDLYIIDDWKYEEDLENNLYSLKSEKTDLRVGLTEIIWKKSEEGGAYILSIHTNSLFY